MYSIPFQQKFYNNSFATFLLRLQISVFRNRIETWASFLWVQVAMAYDNSQWICFL